MSGTTTISALPPAVSVAVTDLVPIDEVGTPTVTKRATVAQITARSLPLTGGALTGPLTILAGGLGVTGTTTINGDTTVTGTLHSTKALTVDAGGVTVGGGGATIIGNSKITGTLEATGLLTADAGLSVTGAALVGNLVSLGAVDGTALNIVGDATVTGTITGNVVQATTLQGGVVNGTSLGINGNATINGILGGVTALTATTVTATTFTGGALNGTSLGITGDGTITGNGSLGGYLIVSGSVGGMGSVAAWFDPAGAQPPPWTAPISIQTAFGVMSPGFFTFSDRRLPKEGIEDLLPEDGVAWVRRGRPRRYRVDGRPQAGFIAQEEIAAGRGDAITAFPDNAPQYAESDGFAPPGHRLSKDYQYDIPYLTAALKWCLERIQALEAAVART